MKSGVHPDYHNIKVVMTNGTSFDTRSTYGKEGDTLQLDVDPNTHPAWTGGGGYINENASQVARFNKRFGGLKFGGGSVNTQAEGEAEAEKKKDKKSETA